MRNASLPPRLLPNRFSLNLSRPCALAVLSAGGLVCVMLNAGKLQATGAQQAAPATSRPVDINLGIRVFQQQCSPCHGNDGKGLSSSRTPDFTNPQVQARLTDEVILNTIRN